MTDYVINKWHNVFSYNTVYDLIRIGSYNLDKFTDVEINEFISDNLTHEYIHKVLFDLFDNTVSHLFDAIEYLFLNDELHQKILFGTKRETYQQHIKKYGFSTFLKHYGLRKCDVLNANILCNTRKKIKYVKM